MVEYYYRNCTWKETPEICMIELTNACNFSCNMCSNKFMTREKGFMTSETFKKTLDECIDSNIKIIKLYTTGESFLHPEFMNFWRLAATYPFEKIMISTNGSLLTEEMMDEFLKSDKFRIQLSFSGWERVSYETKYVGANFEKIKGIIRMITSKIEKVNLPKNTLTINGVVSKSPGAIGKTKDFLKKRYNLDDNQLFIHNANNWVEVFSSKNIKNVDGKRYYCHVANTRVGVLYDGKITACGCLDVNGELIIGYIIKDSLKNIRQQNDFQIFTKKLTEGNISDLMCKRCDSLKEIKPKSIHL